MVTKSLRVLPKKAKASKEEQPQKAAKTTKVTRRSTVKPAISTTRDER